MGALQNEVVLPGNIQAFIDAPIFARASGYLKKWYADIGARVKAGQILADIDAPELDQQVRQAQSAVEQAKAAVDQTLANLVQGKANAELARVTAQRWSNLVAKGVVSKQENDQYQAQYQAQQANVDALGKAIAAARGNVGAAEADLSRLEELQRYKTVKAPFDGVITARNTDIGALVNAGMGGAAQELFHIAATAKLRVYVNVPQTYSQAAVPGIPAELTLSEFPGRRFHGKLVRTADAMDAGYPNAADGSGRGESHRRVEARRVCGGSPDHSCGRAIGDCSRGFDSVPQRRCKAWRGSEWKNEWNWSQRFSAKITAPKSKCYPGSVRTIGSS